MGDYEITLKLSKRLSKMKILSCRDGGGAKGERKGGRKDQGLQRLRRKINKKRGKWNQVEKRKKIGDFTGEQPEMGRSWGKQGGGAHPPLSQNQGTKEERRKLGKEKNLQACFWLRAGKQGTSIRKGKKLVLWRVNLKRSQSKKRGGYEEQQGIWTNVLTTSGQGASKRATNFGEVKSPTTKEAEWREENSKPHESLN